MNEIDEIGIRATKVIHKCAYMNMGCKLFDAWKVFATMKNVGRGIKSHLQQEW